MRPIALAAAASFVALALAGCATPAAPVDADAGGAMPDLVATLRGLPAPALDGEANLQWLESFVEAHQPRITGTPQEKAAGAALAKTLEGLGYEVETKLWNARGLPSADGPLRAVLGVKPGAVEPERLVILGAHYDTSATVGNPDAPGLPFGAGLTTQAAYDNGSGTAMVIELARLLAAVETRKTIVFALFNGEEEGLLASAAYANQLQAEGAKVDTYVGFDMIGINYPATAGCLCIYAGELYSPELNPIQEAVAFDLLGYPRADETVQVFPDHKTRNSDEASFQRAQYPTMRWAGMASASDYWAYHKLNDTVETMAEQAGGRDVLAAGMETATASSYYTVLALDRVTLRLDTKG